MVEILMVNKGKVRANLGKDQPVPQSLLNFLPVFKAGAAKPHRSLTQKQGRYPQ